LAIELESAHALHIVEARTHASSKVVSSDAWGLMMAMWRSQGTSVFTGFFRVILFQYGAE
jgi:hypothetical protein